MDGWMSRCLLPARHPLTMMNRLPSALGIAMSVIHAHVELLGEAQANGRSRHEEPRLCVMSADAALMPRALYKSTLLVLIPSQDSRQYPKVEVLLLHLQQR